MGLSFDIAAAMYKRKRRRNVIGRKRVKRDICKSHKPTREIPFDLVIEILTRLPAKSLMRFKSVSKLWSSLICSQYFNNRFLKVSSSPPRLYMWLGIENSQLDNLLLSSSSWDGPTMSSFVVDQDLTIPGLKGYSLSHFFRGLMCCTNGPSSQIYNTTTRQLAVLPDIEESNFIADGDDKFKNIVYFIGHDPISDQYKVVCTVSRPIVELNKFMSQHWVLVLGGDGSSRWRNIPCPSPHHPLTQGLNINGRMHYLAWVRVLDYLVVVSFHISSETISILQAPQGFFSSDSINLIEYGGEVAMLDYSHLRREGVMELWVMEDAGWSSKTLVLHPSQMHLIDRITMRVQGTTRNGEVIFVPQRALRTRTGGVIHRPQKTTLFYVLLYNLEKNHMRKVEIARTSDNYLTNFWDVIGLDDVDVDNLMHL